VRSRGFALALVVIGCVAIAGVYVVAAAGDGTPEAAVLPVQPTTTSVAARDDGGGLSPKLRLAVRAVDPDDARLPGHVYVVDPATQRTTQEHGLDCMRIYYAHGHGVCLYLARSGVEYRAALLGSKYRVVKSMSISGVPSRTRVSRDGRYGAWTTFTTGDSYTTSGQFSTRTSLLDMRKGRIVADLEQFAVSQDGREIDAPDHNFWGVTFSEQDADVFYATLATGGHHWLVRGTVTGRRVEVLRDAVECPSVSPDGRRIAYKRPLGDGKWRLSVLDLDSLAEHPLAEPRSIDDQAEWLDDGHVAYSDGKDVWSVDADGTGKPTRLVRGAQSPVALRR
jgi:hypothetical protein